MAFILDKDDIDIEQIKKKFNDEINSLNELDYNFFKNKNFFYYLEKKNPEEAKEFLNVYNENLRNFALEAEKIFPIKNLCLLKTGEEYKEVVLTRKEAALIFLLSFFDLIDIKGNYNTNYFSVSNILYCKNRTNFEFGRCFVNYLTIIGKWLKENDPILKEEITYIRQNIKKIDEDKKDVNFCEINIIKEGSLFDGKAEYCIDFANKYIGGGVLNGGCVQEEILFAIEPEAIVSMLFMEVMNENDAIGIFNTIQYSKYKGYGSSFKFVESAITQDKSQIKKHKIIAIDAIPYSYSYNYYSFQKDIKRDIHKAYVGFNLTKYKNDIEKTIATGNWGCGAFGGNHELKFIQQWIAASLAGVKRLDYYTFGEKEMERIDEKCCNEIKSKYQTANQLYDFIINNKKINNDYIIISLLKDKK